MASPPHFAHFGMSLLMKLRRLQLHSVREPSLLNSMSSPRTGLCLSTLMTAHYWKGATYINAMLPFGQWSVPKIFTAIADALEWVILRRGARHVWHYIDDFIVCGPRHQQSVHGHSTLPSPPVASWVCLSLHTKLRGQQQTSPSWGWRGIGSRYLTIQLSLREPDLHHYDYPRPARLGSSVRAALPRMG